MLGCDGVKRGRGRESKGGRRGMNPLHILGVSVAVADVVMVRNSSKSQGFPWVSSSRERTGWKPTLT